MDQQNKTSQVYSRPADLIEKRDGGQQMAAGAPKMPLFATPPPPPPAPPSASAAKPAPKKP